MPKIKVEIEVPNGEYCETEDNICPMCIECELAVYRCVLFDDELEIDDINDCCIRCDKCKQAEVKEQ